MAELWLEPKLSRWFTIDYVNVAPDNRITGSLEHLPNHKIPHAFWSGTDWVYSLPSALAFDTKAAAGQYRADHYIEIFAAPPI